MTQLAVISADHFGALTRAVVVGVSRYQQNDLQDLPGCSREARALASALCDPQGCRLDPSKVSLLTTDEGLVSAHSVRSAFESAAKQATPDEVLLLYFSGHGEAHQSGFVLRTSEDFGVTAADIDNILGFTQARGILLITDCCGGADLAGGAPSLFRGLAKSEFRILLSASRAGESSWELPDIGSVFTSHLLRVVRGEDIIGSGGEIYFNDLFRHLHDEVVNELSRRFPTLTPQEPVVAGMWARDPLIFLHQDLTLKQINIRLRRYSTRDIRRRVLATAAAVFAMALVGTSLVYTFADNHDIIEVDSTGLLSISRGHPYIRILDLPRTEWQLDFDGSSINGESGLSSGPMVLRRGINMTKTLFQQLKPLDKVRFIAWQSGESVSLPDDRELSGELSRRDIPEALSLLARSSANWSDTRLKEVLAEAAFDLSVQEENTSSTPEARKELLFAELRLLQLHSPQSALAAVTKLPIMEYAQLHIDGLARWLGPCTRPLQTYLDRLTSAHPVVPMSLRLDASIRTGCKPPLPSPEWTAQDEHDRRIYAISQDHELSTLGRQGVEAPQVGQTTQVIELAKAVEAARLRGEPVCRPFLARRLMSMPILAQIDAAVVSARACLNMRLALSRQGDIIYLELFDYSAPLIKTGISRIDITHADPETNLSVIQAFDEIGQRQWDHSPNDPSSDIKSYLEERVAQGSPDAQLAAARVLRNIGAPVDVTESDLLRISDLDFLREVILWQARTSQTRAAALLAEALLREEATSLVGLVPMVTKSESSRSKFHAECGRLGISAKRRVQIRMIESDLGGALVFTQHPNRETRQTAASVAVLRPDFVRLVDAMELPYPSSTMVMLREQRRLLAINQADIARLPRWAHRWRLEMLLRLQVKDPIMRMRLRNDLDADAR